MRQQHLRARQILLAQLGLIHLRQAHLAHGGRGLELVNFAWAGAPAKALHALGDRAAGHHDDFAAHAIFALHQRRQLATPFANRDFIQPLALVRHETGANLHHDAACITQNIGDHLQCVGRVGGG